jgi:hypothetical protein
VDAPIPSASVSIAIAANPGVFPRFLTAYRKSCPSVSIFTPQFDQHPVRSTPLQSTPASINPYFRASIPRQSRRSRRNLSRLPRASRGPGRDPGSSPFVQALFHLLQRRVFRPAPSSLSIRTPPQLSSTPPTPKSRQPLQKPLPLLFYQSKMMPDRGTSSFAKRNPS